MIKVKCFGSDSTCSSAESLEKLLSNHYQGKSISVVYASTPHGTLKTEFLDIGVNGEVRKSYGNRDLFSFIEFSEQYQKVQGSGDS